MSKQMMLSNRLVAVLDKIRTENVTENNKSFSYSSAIESRFNALKEAEKRILQLEKEKAEHEKDYAEKLKAFEGLIAQLKAEKEELIAATSKKTIWEKLKLKCGSARSSRDT